MRPGRGRRQKGGSYVKGGFLCLSWSGELSASLAPLTWLPVSVCNAVTGHTKLPLLRSFLSSSPSPSYHHPLPPSCYCHFQRNITILTEQYDTQPGLFINVTVLPFQEIRTSFLVPFVMVSIQDLECRCSSLNSFYEKKGNAATRHFLWLGP